MTAYKVLEQCQSYDEETVQRYKYQKNLYI